MLPSPPHPGALSATSSGSTWWQAAGSTQSNSRATSFDGVPPGVAGRSLATLDLLRHDLHGGGFPVWPSSWGGQLQAASLPDTSYAAQSAPALGTHTDLLQGIDEAALLQALYQCSLQPPQGPQR